MHLGGQGTSYHLQTRTKNGPTLVTHSYWLCWPTRESQLPYCGRQVLQVAGGFKMQEADNSLTIGFLHDLFAWFGVPDCVVNDNGTQFTSAEFEDFCNTFHVKHVTTPQSHRRLNGQAERFVVTLNRALRKHKEHRPTESENNYYRCII